MKKSSAFLSLMVFTLAVSVMARIFALNAQTVTYTYEECLAQGKKITICHATSSETNPYVKETISCNAIYGNRGSAGHFSENGTTLAGHEEDVFADENGLCPGETLPEVTPNPSEEPLPSGMPEPSPTPSASPTVIASVPTNSEGRQTSLANDNLQCTSATFDAVFDVKDHGNPVANLTVTFVYENSTKQAQTDAGGRARVTFTKGSNTSLTATADGYPTQTMFLTMPMDCPTVYGDPNRESSRGQVLGASTLAAARITATSGKVLGASTLADTGSSQDALSYAMILSGVAFIALAAGIHAQKKTIR